MAVILFKCRTAWLRLVFFLKQLPRRIFRLLKGLWRPTFELIFTRSLSGFLVAVLEIPIFILDMFGVPEVYETLQDFCKWNTRSLTPEEVRIGHSIFGESIDYALVRIDEKAVLGPKQKGFAYVSFRTINSYGIMPDHILIHELMHIWQFTHIGSVYAPRALIAQHSIDKYNYGGFLGLWTRRDASIKSFNYEQQADVIMDYYLLSKGKRPQWTSPEDCGRAFPLLRKFTHEVRRTGSDDSIILA